MEFITMADLGRLPIMPEPKPGESIAQWMSRAGQESATTYEVKPGQPGSSLVSILKPTIAVPTGYDWVRTAVVPSTTMQPDSYRWTVQRIGTAPAQPEASAVTTLPGSVHWGWKVGIGVGVGIAALVGSLFLLRRGK